MPTIGSSLSGPVLVVFTTLRVSCLKDRTPNHLYKLQSFFIKIDVGRRKRKKFLFFLLLFYFFDLFFFRFVFFLFVYRQYFRFKLKTCLNSKTSQIKIYTMRDNNNKNVLHLERLVTSSSLSITSTMICNFFSHLKSSKHSAKIKK